MTTGDLLDRVTIQQKTTTADTQGGRSVSWSTLATVWANVRAARANEQIQAQAVGSNIDYTVTIRNGAASVTPSMRLSWTPYGGSARTLQVNGVHYVDGRREFVQITCQEVT
jgi:SPP1 family predicted phage head-tail adaptor